MKNKKGFLLGILVGLLICGTTVYAATTYLASNIEYKNTTVESALNDLYNKKTSGSDESEYLNEYIGTSNQCNGCNGTKQTPTLSVSENTATISFNSSASSQATIYLEIPDISKYKYLKVTASGAATSYVLGISNTGPDVNKYDKIINNIVFTYSNGESKTFDLPIIIDTKNLEGLKYLTISGSKFNNVKVTTQGILK